MVYFETNAELTTQECEIIKKQLDYMLKTDLIFFADSDINVWYTDDEQKYCENFKDELKTFQETFAITKKEIKNWDEEIDTLAIFLFRSEGNYNNADNTSGQYIYSEEQILEYLKILRGE